MPRPVAIHAERISKWFGEGAARTQAVKEVTLDAYFGELLYIVGPSGSGKTTLLSMISGILRPSSGSIQIEGMDIWSLAKDELAEFRLNRIGFVFQDYHLFPRLSTAENVAIPLFLRKREWNASIAEAIQVLEVVGLANRAGIPPIKLSGGEQQRVAIARAMVGGPDLLIFDEPTASLDGETGRNILRFIHANLLNEHRCIIVVTHDSRIFEFANRILKMEDGHLVGALQAPTPETSVT